jgi:hypothetical protein
VRVLVDGNLPAGLHEVIWDGRDGRGFTVAPGFYWAVLDTGGAAEAEIVHLVE